MCRAVTLQRPFLFSWRTINVYYRRGRSADKASPFPPPPSTSAADKGTAPGDGQSRRRDLARTSFLRAPGPLRRGALRLPRGWALPGARGLAGERRCSAPSPRCLSLGFPFSPSLSFLPPRPPSSLSVARRVTVSQDS